MFMGVSVFNVHEAAIVHPWRRLGSATNADGNIDRIQVFIGGLPANHKGTQSQTKKAGAVEAEGYQAAQCYG